VFEEGGLPQLEFRNIYGSMTIGGVPKPVWRAFQLLHEHAGDTRLGEMREVLSFREGRVETFQDVLSHLHAKSPLRSDVHSLSLLKILLRGLRRA